jgi:hypothetical protein
MKMDDGMPFNGLVFGNYCWLSAGFATPSDPYLTNSWTPAITPRIFAGDVIQH